MARPDASPAFRPQSNPQAPAPHKNRQESDGLTVKICALDRGPIGGSCQVQMGMLAIGLAGR